MSPDGGLSLEVIGGRASGAHLQIGDKPLEIGRGAGEEGRLGDDPELSRRHACVTLFEGGKLMIEDLGATNGTFVNGRRITGPVLLDEGDTVEMGDTTLRAVASMPAAPAEAARAAPPARHGGVYTVPTGLLPLLVARAPVRREWIVKAALTALPIVFAVNLFVRTIAVEYFDVPTDIEVMKPHVLVIVSVMPTVGNCVGFYLNFGRPADASTLRFLIPTFMITAVITTIDLILLPTGSGFKEYFVTVLISAVAPTVIVPMLLGLRVRASLRAERELGGQAA